MVLEFIKKIKIWVLSSIGLILLNSCDKKENIEKKVTSETIKITDTCSINGVYFQLTQNLDIAELKINSKDHNKIKKLQLKAPCYFLRNSNKVQTYSYNDKAIENVIIILGDTVGKKEKTYFGFNEKDNFKRICGKTTQAILIKKDSIILTKKILKNGFRCTDSGTDEKDFYDFAHQY
jgi:hypothetical protein